MIGLLISKHIKTSKYDLIFFCLLTYFKTTISIALVVQRKKTSSRICCSVRRMALAGFTPLPRSDGLFGSLESLANMKH